MAKVPKEFEDLIAMALAAQAKVNTQKGKTSLVRELYKQVSSQMHSGEVSPETLAYVSYNLSKVFRRALDLSTEYKPTKRHGVGEDGGVRVFTQEPWMWFFEAKDAGFDDGGGEPGDGDDDDDGGFLDWAPSSEIGRAQGMLITVAIEMEFGEDDAPLPFIREVARRLGGRWGLNGKRGNPNDPSTDLLAWNIPGFKPQCFDVIYDSGGLNRIVWTPLPYGGASVWIAP